MRITLTLFILLITHTISKKLIFIQQVFRHGARNPAFIFNEDYSNISSTIYSEGQLTNEGKNMHYLLGKAIYTKYWKELFKGTPFQSAYNQSIIYVKSTNFNRTIQSAQSHLLGLLQQLPPLTLSPSSYEFSLPPWSTNLMDKPNDTWYVFGNSFKNYHTIPIHVDSAQANLFNQGDFLLAYQKKNCPHQQIWSSQNLQSQTMMKIMKLPSVNQALTALSQALKTKIQYQNAYKYIDNYVSLKYMGFKYNPIFDNPKYKETFSKQFINQDFIKLSSMYLMLYHTQIQKQISSTNFFEATFNNFQNIINNNMSRRIVIYSAHDTTIGAVIASLQLVSVDCIYDYFINRVNNTDTCIPFYPPFASNLIFQLWEDNANYTFKILYNGVEKKIPFCNQKTQCQYSKFKQWFNNFKVDNVNQQCGIYNSEFGLYFVIIILSLVIGALVGYIIYQKKNLIIRVFKKQAQYNKNFQEKQINGKQVQHH